MPTGGIWQCAVVTFQSLIKKVFRLDAQPQSYVLVDKMTLCISTYYMRKLIFHHTHLDTKTVSNVHSTYVRMHTFIHTHTCTHTQQTCQWSRSRSTLCFNWNVYDHMNFPLWDNKVYHCASAGLIFSFLSTCSSSLAIHMHQTQKFQCCFGGGV